MSIAKLSAIMLISYLCSVHARSVSIIGDVRIESGDDGKFICDKIECPSNAVRCVVSKEKDPKDPSILVRINICHSNTGEELQKSVTNETVNPNSQIKVLVEGYRNGGVTSINSINSEDFDAEAFAADMDQFHKNLNRDMANLKENLNREMKNLNENLKENMNELNYKLTHMFDQY